MQFPLVKICISVYFRFYCDSKNVKTYLNSGDSLKEASHEGKDKYSQDDVLNLHSRSNRKREESRKCHLFIQELHNEDAVLF